MRSGSVSRGSVLLLATTALAHRMGKKDVVPALLDPGSCDRLAALDVAQPSRHPLHLLAMMTRILRNHGDNREKELKHEHREPTEHEEDERACCGKCNCSEKEMAS
eukprot:3332431-Prymnesium_polylepis.3